MNKKIKIALLSDWYDWYDHAFASRHDCDVTWKRYTRAWTTRKDDFTFLESVGIETPRYGSPEQLHEQNISHVVHYTDWNAHAGDGKELLTIEEALQQSYSDMFCSEYLEHTYSLRTVAIGYMFFQLKYTSDTWQSNVGDVNIELLDQYDMRSKSPHNQWSSDLCVFAYYLHKRSPLWAIDYVNGKAIDWNPSPGLKWTGIEKHMTPTEVYIEVQDCWREVTWSNQILDKPDWRNYSKAMLKEFNEDRDFC